MVDIDSMPIVGLPDAKNERPCKKKENIRVITSTA